MKHSKCPVAHLILELIHIWYSFEITSYHHYYSLTFINHLYFYHLNELIRQLDKFFVLTWKKKSFVDFFFVDDLNLMSDVVVTLSTGQIARTCWWQRLSWCQLSPKSSSTVSAESSLSRTSTVLRKSVSIESFLLWVNYLKIRIESITLGRSLFQGRTAASSASWLGSGRRVPTLW
jgi:hypothetical protein